MSGERECRRCGETKGTDRFRGRLRICRECEAAYARAYNRANRAAVNETRTRWRRRRGAQPLRRLTTEERRAGYRERYWRDRDARLAYMREYGKANPDKASARAHRRRARLAAVEREPYNPLAVLEAWDGACGICGEDVDPTRYTLDHIVPISRGGADAPHNLAPAHLDCNRRKHARCPWETTNG